MLLLFILWTSVPLHGLFHSGTAEFAVSKDEMSDPIIARLVDQVRDTPLEPRGILAQKLFLFLLQNLALFL